MLIKRCLSSITVNLLRPLRRTAALFLVVALVLPASGEAAAPHPVPLRELSRMARLAFAGTVDRLSYRRDGKYALTDVHFRSVRFARPEPNGTTFVLSLWGGRENGQMTEVSIAPQFRVGERYIVLATSPGSRANWYLPIAGVASGCFRVRGERGGVGLVYDWDDRPIASIAGDHLAVVEGKTRSRPKQTPRRIVRVLAPSPEPGGRPTIALEIYPQELDPGTRVNEDELLEAIRALGQ